MSYKLLSWRKNTKIVKQLKSEKFINRIEGSSKDVETGTYKITLPDNLSLSQTSDLSTILKIRIDARFHLTVNINVADKLINGSIETIE